MKLKTEKTFFKSKTEKSFKIENGKIVLNWNTGKQYFATKTRIDISKQWNRFKTMKSFQN